MHNTATIATPTSETAMMETVPGSSGGNARNKLSILRIDFDELYRRHLSRHGQFGINVLHAISVYGVYFSIYSLVVIPVRRMLPAWSTLEQSVFMMGLSLPYLGLLMINVPFRILICTLLSVAVLSVAAAAVDLIPFWGHLILIVFWHRFQTWSHRYYTVHRDMSEFESRYKKGLHLFILLAVYELPILLHYLISGQRRGTKSISSK